MKGRGASPCPFCLLDWHAPGAICEEGVRERRAVSFALGES